MQQSPKCSNLQSAATAAAAAAPAAAAATAPAATAPTTTTTTTTTMTTQMWNNSIPLTNSSAIELKSIAARGGCPAGPKKVIITGRD